MLRNGFFHAIEEASGKFAKSMLAAEKGKYYEFQDQEYSRYIFVSIVGQVISYINSLSSFLCCFSSIVYIYVNFEAIIAFVINFSFRSIFPLFKLLNFSPGLMMKMMMIGWLKLTMMSHPPLK